MQTGIRRLSIPLILLPIFGLVLPASAVDWDPRFELPKVSGEIYAVHEFQGELLVAGFFTALGPHEFNSIARWDGQEWSPLGPESSQGVFDEDPWWQSAGTVHELFAWNDLMVVAGVFDHAGDQSARNLAAWDGMAWQGLDYPRAVPIYALGEWEGDLVVGASLALSSSNDAVAHRFDGIAWSAIPMPPGIERAYVRCIQENSAILWLGGRFERVGAGGQEALGIMGFDGLDWITPGEGLRSERAQDAYFIPDGLQGVSDLASVDGILIAAGSFRVPSKAIEGLAFLSDTEWRSFTIGTSNHSIVGVGVSLVSLADRLIAVGDLVDEWDDQGVMLALPYAGLDWTRPQLEVLGPYAPKAARSYDSLVLGAGSLEGDLIIGRDSFTDDRRNIHSLALARWSSGTWSTPLPGQGLGGEVDAMTEHEGRLIVGGRFEWAGGVYSPRIAAWTGEAWEPMGGGFPEGNADPDRASSVRALISHNGLLFAGGNFMHSETHSYRVPNSFLAAWDGTQWQYLLANYHEVLDGTVDGNSGVHAFAVFQDRLFVGGQFYAPRDGYSYSPLRGYQGLVYWENGELHTFDQGLSGSPTDRVEALVVDDGRLIAGGRFTRIGGVAVTGLAAFDGIGWMPLEGWEYGFATDLLVNQDGLYVQRREEEWGGVTCCETVRLWTGDDWFSMPRPRSEGDYEGWNAPDGDALVSINGTLIGGRSHLYRWQQQAWVKLPFEFYNRGLGAGSSGTSCYINQLLVAGDRVWISGWFDDVRTDELSGPEFRRSGNLANVALHDLVPPTAVIADRDPRGPVGFVPTPPPTGILENRPNPFNPRTVVRFATASDGWARVEIVSVNGRVVRSYPAQQFSAGEHELVWNGDDDGGRAVASGVYFARLTTPQGAYAHRMALVR